MPSGSDLTAAVTSGGGPYLPVARSLLVGMGVPSLQRWGTMPDAPTGCISYLRDMNNNNHRAALIRDPLATALIPADLQIACRFIDVSEDFVHRKVA